MKPFIAVPEIAIEGMTLSTAPIPEFETEGKNGPSGSTLSDLPPSGWGVEGCTFIKETDVEKSFFQQELGAGLQETPHPLDDFEKPPDAKERVDSADKEATLCLEEMKDQTTLSSPNRMIEQDKNRVGTYLARATILANEAKYKEATDILGKIIEVDNLSIEAYYLLGVLSYKRSNLDEAETQFRKVIYVDPDSVLPYFNLGKMYLYQRRFREAAREFKNAIRLLEKRPKNEQVRFCEDFTVEFLLRACRNSLVEISKRGE
jgi:chemotaxis protein methyltransferase CheR